MKKKWHRFFQKLFVAHIAAFEEQLNHRAPHRPAAHATVIRSSVKRYFNSAHLNSVYVLAFDPLYEEAIDELKKDGWVICLETDRAGELYYGIYENAGKTVPSPRL